MNITENGRVREGSDKGKICLLDDQTCSENCPKRKLFELFGRKYTLDVLRSIMQREHARFNEIARDIGGSPKTVTDRLKEMAAEGIILRTAYAEIPPRVEYSLTEKGLDLRPVMRKIMEWSDKWD